ncbi:AP endonuclease [Fulvimarina endophytica]|uniref:AP endonuclease n=1 Tax=Fulvimarina endophytica TaxID=2293836 RepID=A0A371X7L2_9HYPH|nr:endonuclease/exonuclease/phosphatase family protein [Fulvimarina endophytica]RFC65196.1 AP endonuclease [Fulvimarina endophytica]
MTRFGRLAVLAATLCALLLLAGLMGGLAAPLDSFSHFRPYLAVLAIVAGFVGLCLGHGLGRWVALGAMAVGIASAVTVAPFLGVLSPSLTNRLHGFAVFAPIAEPDEAARARELSLLQLNVLYSSDPAAGLAAIRRANTDFVTLEEVAWRWPAALETLSDLYPHRAACGAHRGGESVVILSKYPFTGEAVCMPDQRFGAREVDLGEGRRMTVAVQHLFWPWPRGQNRQIAQLSKTLGAIKERGTPLIVGGDFNAAPWSAAMRTFAAKSGTRPVPSIGPSFAPRALPDIAKSSVGLLIDNVLVSPDVAVLSAQTLPPVGSDHLPVLVRFTLPGSPTPGTKAETGMPARS